jgi:hypothetical protein
MINLPESIENKKFLKKLKESYTLNERMTHQYSTNEEIRDIIEYLNATYGFNLILEEQKIKPPPTYNLGGTFKWFYMENERSLPDNLRWIEFMGLTDNDYPCAMQYNTGSASGLIDLGSDHVYKVLDYHLEKINFNKK